MGVLWQVCDRCIFVMTAHIEVYVLVLLSICIMADSQV